MNRLLGEEDVEDLRLWSFAGLRGHNSLTDLGEVGVCGIQPEDGVQGVFVSCSRPKQSVYRIYRRQGGIQVGMDARLRQRMRLGGKVLNGESISIIVRAMGGS